MLTWVHFGDLHASNEDGWRSVEDFKALIFEANRHVSWAADFAVLPGDNANHGAAEQYELIAEALDALDLRWFAIPGDHDFEPGSLDAFYRVMKAPHLPAAVVIKGRRCLFLDLVSAGGGGPDFRLGADQRAWLEAQLDLSQTDAERPVVFMHAFPGDLAEDAEAVGTLFAKTEVACVDTGHTHYNEVLNDGQVIYTATRSTGQIEEGPVGFSLHAVDGSAMSWRFKPLETPWPFVLITSPVDRRLATDPSRRDKAASRDLTVRAKVFGDDVAEVFVTVDQSTPLAMTPVIGETGVWAADVTGLHNGSHRVRVKAAGRYAAEDIDEIDLNVCDTSPAQPLHFKEKLGHDVHSIGAWPIHGVLGSQLGPNKNGRKW